MLKRVGNERIHIEIESEHRTSKGRLQLFSVVARKANPKRQIGCLDIEVEDNGRAYVSAVKVSPRYRGKGVGKALYETAIAFYGELNTRFEEASTMAQRVWLSLIRCNKYSFDWQEGTYICVWPKNKRRKRRK